MYETIHRSGNPRGAQRVEGFILMPYLGVGRSVNFLFVPNTEI